MSKKIKALMAATMGLALSAETKEVEPIQYGLLPNLGEINPYRFIPSFNGPIFTPHKHTKMKYADHKRMKAKRKNKKHSK